MAMAMALGVAGCAGDRDKGDEGAAKASTGSTTSTTAGITAGDPRSPGDTTGSTASGASTTSPPVAPGQRAAGWPAPKEQFAHGGTAWGVYLAVERGTSTDVAKLRSASQQAASVGYEASDGDVGCDRGAREALRLDPAKQYVAAVVYFGSEADARKFVDLYQPGVVGIARVETFCLD